MARYTGTISTPHSPPNVWSYLADLRSVAEWDPSVVDARLVSGEPGSVGARYEIDVRLLGRTVTLPYVTLESEPPSRVLFGAETGLVTIRDEARITPCQVGTSVTWDADVSLRSAWRLLDPALRLAFNRIGARAERGLAERLGDPNPSEGPGPVAA